MLELMQVVRQALRAELTARGHRVASDTLGSRGELYITGDNDLAAALFDFKPDVATAIGEMYQGSWIAGLPPRFAVLPESAASDERFELLEQMRIIPLLYRIDGDVASFEALDEALETHLKA